MFDLIYIAKDLGINCIKIQSYRPEIISADVKLILNLYGKKYL